MLMALKYRGYSIRYRHSSLKVDNRRRSTVSRQDNRLSSKHIFRRHYFLQSFQRKILCYLISTDRIGTYVSVKIEFTLINRIRLRTFLSLDNQGTRHVPAIAY